jgi:hypothetical protein
MDVKVALEETAAAFQQCLRELKTVPARIRQPRQLPAVSVRERSQS